jgi:NADPH2:quinone reductase
MKAIRVEQFGDPSVLKLAEVPEPQPGPGQVLIEVKAVGINPVETYVRAGTYASKPTLPYTPGTDCGGIVKKVGDGVKQFKAGERVYTQGSITGTYAQLCVCDEASVHPLPKAATFQQGAALGVPYATAYYGLFIRGKIVAGETVLVHGASGGVGIAAVQLAVAIGATVFGTGGSARGRQLVSENGAHRTFDHHNPKYLTEIMDATAGRGVDAIMEMSAHTNLAKDPTILAKYGRVIVIGNRGPIEINARDFMQRAADMRAMSLMNAEPKELVRIHAAIVAGIANQTLRPVVGRELALGEAAQAHKDVLEAGAYGKIVLTP